MRRRHTRELGQALVMFVLALGVLMSLMGLIVDVGAALVERGRLQNAADAAALAGARELPADPALAEARAREWAADNGITGADQLAVEITSEYSPYDSITVRVNRDVQFRFMNVLGVSSDTVGAEATARIGSPAGLDRFIPFAVESPTLAGLNPGDSAILKYDSQDQTNGNSLALAFPGSTGASDFRDAIYNGSQQSYCVVGEEYEGCFSSISTEPGAMVGPTRQGIHDLLTATSSTCDEFDEVFQADPANPANILITTSCNPFPPYNVSTSKRVVIVPVIEGLCAGRCDVQIVRFALFFVGGINCSGGASSCEVSGQYAEASFDAGNLRLGPYSGDAAFNFARLVR